MVSTVGILVLIIAIPVLAFQEQEVDANDSTDSALTYRVKRMVFSLLSSLLRNSQFLTKVKGTNYFIRDGTIRNAKKDFMSLDPKMLRVSDTSIIGTAEGKTIELNVRKGYPMIIIRPAKGKLNGIREQEATDAILYRNK